MKRKIAAILAADVAQYSRLVAEDEEGTIRRLGSYRKVFDDHISQHGGRIFNTAGDAVLAEFPSAVDAVRCAIDAQESLRTRNLGYHSNQQMLFRIGITIGDVIERGGDLLGDGVNIAARLEGLAAPGGICISRSVHEAVANKLTLRFDDLGQQQVKNIPQPVHAYSAALAAVSTAPVTPPGPAVPAAAVPAPRRGVPVGAAVVTGLAFAGAAGYAGWTLLGPGLGPAPSPATPAVAVRSRAPDAPATSPRAEQAAEPKPAAAPTGGQRPAVAIEPSKPAAPIAPAPPSPAEQAARPGPVPPRDLHGEWLVNRLSDNCPIRSLSFALTVGDDGLTFGSGGPTGGRGTISAGGAIEFEHATGDGPRVRYQGLIAGVQGRGKFEQSGACSGTFSMGRAVTPAAAAKQKAPTKLFDGWWQAIVTGGPGCAVKTNTWRMEISNGAIVRSTPEPGFVDADGTFSFSSPSRSNADVTVYYRGKLAGNEGKGTYVGGRACVGSIELKRAASR